MFAKPALTMCKERNFVSKLIRLYRKIAVLGVSYRKTIKHVGLKRWIECAYGLCAFWDWLGIVKRIKAVAPR